MRAEIHFPVGINRVLLALALALGVGARKVLIPQRGMGGEADVVSPGPRVVGDWEQYQRQMVPWSRTRNRERHRHRQDTLQHNENERPSLSSGRRFPRLKLTCPGFFLLAVATALSAGARSRLSAAESLADRSHLTAAGHPTARNYPTAAEAARTAAGRPVARQAQLATAEYAGPWNH